MTIKGKATVWSALLDGLRRVPVDLDYRRGLPNGETGKFSLEQQRGTIYDFTLVDGPDGGHYEAEGNTEVLVDGQIASMVGDLRDGQTINASVRGQGQLEAKYQKPSLREG